MTIDLDAYNWTKKEKWYFFHNDEKLYEWVKEDENRAIFAAAELLAYRGQLDEGRKLLDMIEDEKLRRCRLMEYSDWYLPEGAHS